jgi:hypothetical protein
MPKQKLAHELMHTVTSTLPWSCTHFGDLSEIEANIGGKWETIAEVHSVGNLDAEDIADLIVRAVNECAKGRG